MNVEVCLFLLKLCSYRWQEILTARAVHVDSSKAIILDEIHRPFRGGARLPVPTN
jgi:hypothetical protein